MAGGENAGLVGPEPTLFLKGLFESRGEGLRSVVAAQLAGFEDRGRLLD